MKTAFMTRGVPGMLEVNLEDLAAVCAGTFTPNTYSEAMYHAVGISTRYNFFEADEFWFMGQPISYDMANDIVRIARQVSEAINQGHHGANIIGYDEEAFIRAFNSQLKIKYGITWSGLQGWSL